MKSSVLLSYCHMNVKCNRLSDVIPALVELVDPENVDVGQAPPLPDGNGGVGDGGYGFRSKLSKGSSADLDNGNETKRESEICS